MARINLLPWRAELRREQRVRFLSVLAFAAVVAAAAVGAVHLFYAQKISYQNQRNNFLQGQIKLLDKKIEEIKNLRHERERLVKRIEAIQTLETNRPLEVRLFDEIVNTLPDGVFLKSIAQKGTSITVTGTAQSQSRVSSYMRNIEQSKWITKPKLEVVQTTTTKGGERLSDFTLNFEQVVPKSNSDEDEVTSSKAGGNRR